MRRAVHPEDIKATIRKRFGSLGSFEKARTLKARSVTDVLRGKRSRKTAQAIANEVGKSIHELFPNQYATANADCSSEASATHRQNGGVA